MMPPQLARAKRPKRSEPRPLVETLPTINVNDLPIPRDYQTYIAPNIFFRYPHISGMRISHFMVEFAHSNRVQTFGFKAIKTGFGGNHSPRYAFICECGHRTTKLYFRHQNLGCRVCLDLTYASRALDKRTRPALKAIRLHKFLEFKTGMHKHNKQRLHARIRSLPRPSHIEGKRLNHHKTQLPLTNYNTRGAAHWL